MSTFTQQLRLAEKAAEDIYFAKVSRELIEALHGPVRARKPSITHTHASSARRGAGKTPRVSL